MQSPASHLGRSGPNRMGSELWQEAQVKPSTVNHKWTDSRDELTNQ
jgi:hypothetical protein